MWDSVTRILHLGEAFHLLFALAVEGQVHTHQLPWIPSLCLHGAHSRSLPTPLNPGGFHHFLSVFNQCSCFSHQFEENKIIWLLISKHFILSQFCLSAGPVCCTESQLWICQSLRKGIQLFLARLMLRFIKKHQFHQLHCYKCFTHRNGDKHVLKSFAKLVSQRGRGL